jgi:hypothetical protein
MHQSTPRWRRCVLPFVLIVTASMWASQARAKNDSERGHRFFMYQLTGPVLTQANAQALADSMRFVPLVDPAVGGGAMAFTDANGVVRLLFSDGGIRFFPDLGGGTNPPPSRGQAMQMAKTWLGSMGLPMRGNELRVEGVVTLSNEPATMAPTPTGVGGPISTGPQMDVLRTVEFVRIMDGLEIRGPDSTLSVDLGGGGIAGGSFAIEGVSPTGTPVDIINRAEATKQFLSEFPYAVQVGDDGDDDQGVDGDGDESAPPTSQPTAGAETGRLVSVKLIYYEQGEQFLQPAYLFRVVLTSPEGLNTGMTWLVPAVQNTPEPIVNQPRLDLPPAVEPIPSTFIPPPICVQPTDIKYGRYVLRQDSDGWLVDAQGFGANIDATNTARRFFFPGTPPVTDYQFYWNYPWLWEPSGSPATDSSPYYPGSVNLALIEGHGAPWEITTLKNCCDIIDLPFITGFGGYHDPAELTDYVIWQSCDVIPAPGDPYGGDYASPASPFDVWFHMFQGMRGTYGYHTTMGIWNGVAKAFGGDLGWGAQNLSAWFTECNTGVQHHDGGWNYGAVVLVSGHEGDTLYDTCPLPPPGSLTIWWQHP